MTTSQAEHAPPADPTRPLLPDPGLGAIFGTSRSGSTWLGALIGAHPDVTYRFEPFRRGRRDPRISGLGAALRDQPLDASTLATIDAFLREAHPWRDKAPFLPKRHERTFGRTAASLIARRLPPLAAAYRRFYSVGPGPRVVFKEVDLPWLLRALVLETEAPVVYLVRSPFGYVASQLRGQAEGHMRDGRVRVLESTLPGRAPDLARYLDALPTMSDAQRNAIVWRMDVEEAIAWVDRGRRSMVVVYEQLCADPHGVLRAVLAHLGLPPHPQCDAFVDASTGRGPSAGRDLARHKYFSIFRNPAESAHKWREQLDAAQIAAVEEIVADSPVVRRFRDQGLWEAP